MSSGLPAPADELVGGEAIEDIILFQPSPSGNGDPEVHHPHLFRVVSIRADGDHYPPFLGPHAPGIIEVQSFMVGVDFEASMGLGGHLHHAVEIYLVGLPGSQEPPRRGRCPRCPG